MASATKKCGCGCGKELEKGMRKYFSYECNDRAKKARDKKKKWIKQRGVTENKLDDLARENCRKQYNNLCAKCGKDPKYKDDGTIAKHHDWHHIFTRRRKNTRWLKENSILLCSYCHKQDKLESAHEAPEEFRAWLLSNIIIEDAYYRLMHKSNEKYVKDLDRDLEYLKNW